MPPCALWRRSRGRLALAAIALTIVSCETVPTGPSLANVTLSGPNGAAIQTRAGWLASQLPTVLAAGSATARDPTVCCCHIRAVVTNGNSVPVHVVMQFAAMDASKTELARIVNFAEDLLPGASYQIPDDGPGAAGFLLPCAAIDHVDYQLDVKALNPPLL